MMPAAAFWKICHNGRGCPEHRRHTYRRLREQYKSYINNYGMYSRTSPTLSPACHGIGLLPCVLSFALLASDLLIVIYFQIEMTDGALSVPRVVQKVRTRRGRRGDTPSE
jgi:hypothetical protein